MFIGRNDTVAVLVDYQDKILNTMYNKDELMHNSKIFLQGLKILNIPMIKTQQYTKGLGMTNTDISEAAGLSEDDYVDKVKFSAYDVIEPFVKGKKNVLVCGIESHVCVLQTAMELKANGYNAILVVDCVSSRYKQNKKIAIKRAIQEGILVTSYESALFELAGASSIPEFKQLSNLIK